MTDPSDYSEPAGVVTVEGDLNFAILIVDGKNFCTCTICPDSPCLADSHDDQEPG